jgi:hypothetical protein
MTLKTRPIQVAIALGALLVSAQASAQFSSLDPQQVSTSAGVNLSVVIVDSDQEGAEKLDSVGRADLYAEIGFVDFSLYGELPVFFTLAGSPSEATIGNLEAGVAHRYSMDGPMSLVSHVGLVIPTSSKSQRKSAVAFAGSTGVIRNLYINSTPELWALRVATSPRLDFGALFMQADLGFDFLFPDSQSDEVGLRTSIGAGVNAAIATVTAEIANAGLISEGDTFEQTFSIGIDLKTPVIQPRVTFTTGLSDDVADNYTLTFGAAIEF